MAEKLQRVKAQKASMMADREEVLRSIEAKKEDSEESVKGKKNEKEERHLTFAAVLFCKAVSFLPSVES